MDTTGEVEIWEHDGVWYAEAAWLDQLMEYVNFSDYESRNWFDQKLRASGLFEKMEAAGISDGDTVDLYGLQFEYQS